MWDHLGLKSRPIVHRIKYFLPHLKYVSSGHPGFMSLIDLRLHLPVIPAVMD